MLNEVIGHTGCMKSGYFVARLDVDSVGSFVCFPRERSEQPLRSAAQLSSDLSPRHLLLSSFASARVS